MSRKNPLLYAVMARWSAANLKHTYWATGSWDLVFLVPGVDAGEIDVLPAERRDVLEEVIGRDPVVPAQMRDGSAEIDGVPVHDGADDEIDAIDKRAPFGITFTNSISTEGRAR